MRSEYPTEEQMKEMWEALEEGDDRAILAVLHQRKMERGAEKIATDKPEGDSTSSKNANG